MTPKLITQTKNKAVAKTTAQTYAATPLGVLLFYFVEKYVAEPEIAGPIYAVVLPLLAGLTAWLHNTVPNKDDRQRKAEVKRLTAEAQEDLRNQRLAQAVAQVVSTQNKIDQEPPKSDPRTYV